MGGYVGLRLDLCRTKAIELPDNREAIGKGVYTKVTPIAVQSLVSFATNNLAKTGDSVPKFYCKAFTNSRSAVRSDRTCPEEIRVGFVPTTRQSAKAQT